LQGILAVRNTAVDTIPSYITGHKKGRVTVSVAEILHLAKVFGLTQHGGQE
jgi:hypothetical protein